ncbi:MAG: extracellular solute-binding protein [Clostridium sp.]|nr:extracellular solute-binding protein [Clostridium sp.]
MRIREISRILPAFLLLLTLAACSKNAGNAVQKGNANQNNAPRPNDGNNTVVRETEETGAAAGDNVETITVLTNRRDLLDTKFAEYKLLFETDNPEIVVEFKALSQYEDSAAQLIDDGDYGDVLLIPHNISDQELAEYFEPLGTVEELSKNYDSRYLWEKQSDGVVYGLAQYGEPQGIAYNRRVFEKAGIAELPTTLKEFKNVLRTIKTRLPDVTPFYKADTGYTDKKLLNQLSKAGLFDQSSQPGWLNARIVFNRGEIACMMADWKQLAELQQADVNPDDIAFMPYPYNTDGVQSAEVTIDYCYAINKNSEHKEAARAWIDYMLRRSGFAVSEGAISIANKAELPKILKDFDGVELVVESAQSENMSIEEKP